MSLDQYLELLDWTGRQPRKDKSGAIPEKLEKIITRLDIEPTMWVEAMKSFTSWFGSIAGSAERVLQHAKNAGGRWYHGMSRCRDLFPSPDESS
ncbi:MAG: hypothetical protein GY926_17245 [bacterium]|nr:hypothetical protein [bacterium]